MQATSEKEHDRKTAEELAALQEQIKSDVESARYENDVPGEFHEASVIDFGRPSEGDLRLTLMTSSSTYEATVPFASKKSSSGMTKAAERLESEYGVEIEHPDTLLGTKLHLYVPTEYELMSDPKLYMLDSGQRRLVERGLINPLRHGFELSDNAFLASIVLVSVSFAVLATFLGAPVPFNLMAGGFGIVGGIMLADGIPSLTGKVVSVPVETSD